MKKQRFFAGILAGAVLAAGLAGCGSAPSDSSAPASSGSAAASGSSGVVEVTIPSYKTGENVGAVFFEPQVERFNQAYEGQYHIILESVPQDTFLDQMKMLAQQGELPVLVQSGDVDRLTNVVYPNGLAYDLSGWLEENPELKARLLPDGLAFCTDDSGAVYSMPLATVRPTGFFWNSALWDTQEDLSAMTMEQFIAALGDQKIAFSTAENGWVAALFLTAAIADEEGGIQWLQGGVENRITDFSEPAFVNAVATLQQMLQNNAASNSIGAAYADAANAFMSNQAAVIANGPWMSADFAETNSANWSNGFNGADVRAALFPGQVGIANTATYGEWFISANAAPEEIELALAFLEFINSPEELEAYLLAEGGDAPGLTYSDGFKAEQGKTQVLADLAADTTADTVFVPCILDVIPSSVANSDFGMLLPSLADGSFTPEDFAQRMTQAATEATAE